MSNASKVSVLVVDDHPGSLEFVSSALRTDGVDVLTSTNPEDALEKIYSIRPQVVLTDLVMPGMTGMELLERIVEFDPSIQVVLMTAHYSTESAVEAIRKGACDYLDKPIKVGHAARKNRQPDRECPADAARRQTGAGAARQLPVRRHRRQEPADVGSLLPHSPYRSPFPHGADHRRNRYRQGPHRARAAPLVSRVGRDGLWR